MTIIQKNDSELIITEKVPAGLRIFLSILGLIAMTVAPYKLLIQPDWEGFSLYLVIPLIISFGAILIGGIFIIAGIFGLNQTLIVSAKMKSIQYSYESVLLPLRKKTYKFTEITSLEIITHDWTDGPSTYGIQVNLSGGEKISTGSFKNENEAGHQITLIEQLIH
jgi:hypothetical protein